MSHEYRAYTVTHSAEGRAGVFSWCMISVKREFNKLLFLTRDLKICVSPEDAELLTLFYVIWDANPPSG